MQSKTFSVPCLPHLLSTVASPAIGQSGMLNYSFLLKRSFYLEESILIPYLANLKDHLEEFQVFLGDVESWLLGSSRGAIFIRDTFLVPVQVIPEKSHFCVLCDYCIRFGDTPQSHKKIKLTSSTMLWMCQGIDMDGVVGHASFVKQSMTILEAIPSSDDYNLSFDVSNSSGQERLTKFLAFIKHPTCII